ncbi:MAG: hypothetical protein R3C20_06405 [Planctomycetaceae bacterium]
MISKPSFAVTPSARFHRQIADGDSLYNESQSAPPPFAQYSQAPASPHFDERAMQTARHLSQRCEASMVSIAGAGWMTASLTTQVVVQIASKQKPISSPLRHFEDAAAIVARTTVTSESKPKSAGTEPPSNRQSQGDNPSPHR